MYFGFGKRNLASQSSTWLEEIKLSVFLVFSLSIILSLLPPQSQPTASLEFLKQFGSTRGLTCPLPQSAHHPPVMGVITGEPIRTDCLIPGPHLPLTLESGVSTNHGRRVFFHFSCSHSGSQIYLSQGHSEGTSSLLLPKSFTLIWSSQPTVLPSLNVSQIIYPWELEFKVDA